MGTIDANATVTAAPDDPPKAVQRLPLSERLALSPKEVSEALGMGRSATYDAIKNGQIKSVKIGGLIRVPVAALKALLDDEPEAVRLVRKVG